MCRFLLVRSKNKINPEKFLREFALMCQKSRAPDGDWQGDGWGIAIKNSRLSGIHDAVNSHSSQTASGQNSKLKDQKWEVYKSLKPIWEESDKFQEFGETDIFVAHARSSGFPNQKGIIEYNQPYIEDSLCYVFNGMIRGVRLSVPLDGKIGAQKIFTLLKQKTETNSIEGALRQVDELIINNAKKVEGMNIGLVRDDKFYVLCEYERNADYFRIKYYQDDKIALVCSEPIGSYQWRIMIKSEILVL